MTHGNGVESARESGVGCFSKGFSAFPELCQLRFQLLLVSCLTFILFEFLSLGSSVGWGMLQECFYFGGLSFFLEWFFVCLLHTVFLSSFCFLLWFCVAAFPCSPPHFAPVCSGSSVQTFSLCWFRVGEFSLPACLVVWDTWALLWAAVWSPEGAGVRRGPQPCRHGLPRLACLGSFPYIVEFLLLCRGSALLL